MTELTLPGTLPGLLQVCSRVRHDDGRRGTVVGLSPGGSDSYPEEGSVLVCFDGAWDACPEEVSLELLGLDLTDATGREHAAWWLADQMAADPMDLITHSPFFEVVFWANEGSDEVGTFLGWALNAPAGRWHFLGWDCLHDLDPEDPRTLPDGSRWVDAEALRLVCLHVAEEVPRG